jgi:ABC-2 type transport system permease protein
MMRLMRRELAGMFHAPIAVVVGVLFLASQGASFWAVVEVLSDPRQPAPFSSVLAAHFAGSQVYFSGAFVLIAVITMRLIAEERRGGTWEVLLTAPVTDLSVVLGKWLAALAFYLLLWLPTLGFVFFVDLLSSASLDWGVVLCTYLGVALGGAAFCAVGLAFSASTSNQIVAATATYAFLTALLFVGELPTILGSSSDSTFFEVAEVVGLRGHFGKFARGELSGTSVAFFVALASAGLVTCHAMMSLGRRQRNEIQRRIISAGLATLIAAELVVLVANRHVGVDLSKQQFNGLRQETLELLATVDGPVSVVLVPPTDSGFAPVFERASLVLERFLDEQPLLRKSVINPVAEPTQVNELAELFGIAREQLGEGGAVVFSAGQRRRIVEVLDMASFDVDQLGAGRVSELRAERSFAAALADVTFLDRPTLCLSEGHGEVRAGRRAPAWQEVVQRLQREGVATEIVARLEDIPKRCRALALMNPIREVAPAEVSGIESYLSRGGRVFLALGYEEVQKQRGLRVLLDQRGLSFTGAVVVDPTADVGLPMAWASVDGYGDHVISQPLRGRRYTVWQSPSELELDGRWTELITSSRFGWAETRVEDYLRTGTPVADEEDRHGVRTVAAASGGSSGHRLVVFAARVVPEHVAGPGWSNHYLAYRSLAWLLDRISEPAIAARVPVTVRLVLSDGQRYAVAAVCIGGIPALFLIAGGLLWRRRRRE